MTDLYKAMLKERVSPAAAVRAAQIEIMKDQRWQAPYFWVTSAESSE